LFARVEEVLDDHHCVIALLERLLVKVTRELWERLAVVVDGDGDILLRGAELAADLVIQAVNECCHRGDTTIVRMA
jgi:hypothetical protein